jgi:uncharacterized protein
MVSPTLRDRIPALDVLRGFAVLGILIANIPFFASLDFAGMGAGRARYSGVDLWLETLTTVFVAGKMRSTLAILFGIGVWLQYQKRSQIEGNWPGGYLRRSLCLAVIGIFHGLFLWHGDILFFYAGMSVLTALLVKVNEVALKTIIGIGFGLSLIIGVGFVLLLNAFPMANDPALAAYGVPFVSGTYLDQVKARLFLYPVTTLILFFQAGAMLPLFLLGALWGKSGVLANPSKYPNARKAALGVGFGIGLPLNLLGFLKLKGNENIGVLMEFSGGPVMAIGIVMLGAIIVERGGLTLVTKNLAKVGRVALTTYLSQSLLASLVCYSWGFGLIGRVTYTQQLEIVAGIWVMNILFARLWLRRYAMGPVEWLLRSLTERSRLSNRIEAA